MSDRGVYVLELNDPGHFYIGQSECISRRIQQHIDGEGSHFCLAHGGVKCRQPTKTKPMRKLCLWEQMETIYWMLKKGFNKVRGWEFTSVTPLSPQDAFSLRKIIVGVHDLCRKCGRKGHMANQCNQEPTNWMRRLCELC